MTHLGPKAAALETEKADLESEKLSLQQTKTVLTKLAAKLEEGGVDNAAELTQNYMGVLENVDGMAKDLSEVSWRFLMHLHPEFEKIPKDHPLRTMFTGMLNAGDHFNLFAQEKSYLDKLERAYELCAFRTKTDLSQFAPAAAAKPAQPAAAAKGPATAALHRPPRLATAPPKRGGSLVADGARAPTHARRGIDERSDAEVMDRYEDMLDGPN
jgi:hypothetical protein